ncbi:MAG: hypothetical protein Q4B48_07475, partial [Syntrophomonadaceae bacterium]|nr:hypothetical protein [Syntrophomonadaceae bacterium]
MEPVMDQKTTFWKIIRASLVNVLGFGGATFGVIFLSRLLNIDVIFIVLAIIIAIIALVSVSGLLVFIGYTIKGIPQTMEHRPEGMGFFSLYGYIIAALLIRCVEGAICVYCVIQLYL